MNEKGKVIFITGIDTNIGKTFATGLLARALARKGERVITQKMVQTGCELVSEDIEMHRKLDAPEATGDSLHGGRPRGADLPLYLLVSLLAAHGGRARRERTGYGGCYGGDTPFAGVL